MFTGGFTDDENVEKALEDFGFSGINWKKTTLLTATRTDKSVLVVVGYTTIRMI